MTQIEKIVPFNILLADDDKDDHYFFNRAIKLLPFPVVLDTVIDGEQLLNWLYEGARPLPDVLFLDINMPRKNGLECLVEIRAEPTLENLPVIIYSTAPPDIVADEFYAKGAHYYLCKGEYEVLREYIRLVRSLLSNNSKQPARPEFVLTLDTE